MHQSALASSSVARTVFALSFLLLVGDAAAAAQLGTNLLANPDAEAGTAASGSPGSEMSDLAIPGWTKSGRMTAIEYSDGAGYRFPLTGFPAPGDPGPADRLRCFFAGGYGEWNSISQTIDVSDLKVRIDRGEISYELSGWLGGWASQDDEAEVVALFLNKQAALDYAVIGPVRKQDRIDAFGGPVTGLLERSTTGVLPVGTRAIEIIVHARRFQGFSDDGYADNLAFVLNDDDAPRECPVDLGTAGLFAVLGGEGKWVTLDRGTVNGHVGVESDGKLDLMARSTLNGDVYLNGPSHEARVRILEGTHHGDVIEDQDLVTPAADTSAASRDAAALASTQTFTTLSRSRTIQGNGGVNVIGVRDLLLDDSDKIVLQGGPNDVFVVNVTGKFALTDRSSIVGGGDVGPDRILINVVGAGHATIDGDCDGGHSHSHSTWKGSARTCKGACKDASVLVHGTLLGPDRKFELEDVVLKGALLGRTQSIEIGWNARIDYVAQQCGN